MNRTAAFALLLVASAAPVWAQDPAPSSAAAYDRCLAAAAVRVSYTDARDEEVYAIARRRCANARAALAKAPQMLAALDAVDATSASNFPDWIGRLRERRQLRAIGLPIPVDPGYR